MTRKDHERARHLPDMPSAYPQGTRAVRRLRQGVLSPALAGRQDQANLMRAELPGEECIEAVRDMRRCRSPHASRSSKSEGRHVLLRSNLPFQAKEERMTNDEEMFTLLAAALADIRHGRHSELLFRLLEALAILERRIAGPSASHSDECVCHGSGICGCARCRVVQETSVLRIPISMLGPCQHANEQGAPML